MFPLDKIQLPIVKENDLDDVPPAGIRMAKPDGDHRLIVQAGAGKKVVQAYLASIAFADTCLGRVLRALDSGPNASETIIMYWTDHGWHLGEKQHWRKFTLWERSTRMPMMMSVPGITKPNTRCDRVVSLLDVYPTFIDLLDLPPKSDAPALGTQGE
jgi:arylsulfatase A-like enzyme